jgi:hypothetical protein
MILEEEPILRPVYMPFSVGESGSGLTSSSTQLSRRRRQGRCPMAARSRGSTFRKAERRWKKWSTPWWSWPCASQRQSDPRRPLLDISRDALRYKLKKFGTTSSRPRAAAVDSAV